MNKSQLVSSAINMLQREQVDLGNGEQVLVREMTAGERDRYQMQMMARDARGQLIINPETKQPVIDATNVAEARLWLVAYCTIDEQLNRIFGDDEVALIGGLPNAFVEKIADVARRLSGLNDDAVDDAGKG